MNSNTQISMYDLNIPFERIIYGLVKDKQALDSVTQG